MQFMNDGIEWRERADKAAQRAPAEAAEWEREPRTQDPPGLMQD